MMQTVMGPHRFLWANAEINAVFVVRGPALFKGDFSPAIQGSTIYSKGESQTDSPKALSRMGISR